MTESRFRLIPSPVGDVLVVAALADPGLSDADAGIITAHPLHASVERELERLAHTLGRTPVEDDDIAPEAAAQLDEYFAGTRTRFDLRLDWRFVRGFTRTALEAVCEIPYGETAGYGEVAIAAGSPRAARAVGTACANTPFSIVVPVHRVIRADGSLGEYGGRPDVKRFLLDLETAGARRGAGE
ncbi:methylated-DNA--[protein]-cysteine S-methyltransferase [Microbacterium rhizomatis]|uniref:methylated-DNA--[protein]-cysteine S-methyltransferase n=1 Tax=Microbacterium rhizomatis TaxID=1631477 RepID=A0A5J5IWN4_9MICO|nr:methylated-DNA--[protein]-cysteine S-methyltransferase [Microbacterium rhizomatis]KAA9105562.1 methylated-DNA--[protein]-cysteine S-methyltransferase [Microbacterium rhizomatis]